MLGGASLRGSDGQLDAEEVGSKDKEGKIAITRNFFFQKLQKDDPNAIVDEAPVSNMLPLPPGARSHFPHLSSAMFSRARDLDPPDSSV